MQQYEKKMVTKCRLAVTAMFWTAGLLMAGSDSLYMPWVNGLGLIVFSVTSFCLGNLLHRLPEKSQIADLSGQPMKSLHAALSEKKTRLMFSSNI